ncbi:lipopolysaccharide kinase InaA family protein [Adhaeretor mobilis]|uniref:3-deoxy-D-manno-octulosonic-acid kinase n=1 Tax=Adhaeretor mobilis TaxID=1930276 RepID=A0A517MPR2_9BACT|nr:lipopolysaccharide kinase InaA family protein [Adhaeretor mobilis]QDS96870.1 3-deoxy-D-manno-octulosonic-acid kinase [Adhaeretor mobilis]
MRQSFSSHRIKALLTVHRAGLTRKLFCDSSLPADLVEALWDDPDRRLVASATTLQEKERCAVLRVDHPQQGYLLKRHVWGGAYRSARMLLRKPSATACASIAALLSENGIPTPKIRGCVVDGIGPLSHRSYLLTDFIHGTTLFHAIRSGLITDENLPDVARQVATIWQKLIELNISHNDLKPENFMVDRAQRVWLIDFEKTKRHSNRSELSRRHLEDAERFLHVRCWRENVDAAEVFRQELLQTSLQPWAHQNGALHHHLLRVEYSEAELSNKISVIVPLSKQETVPECLSSTIESVRDVADEILLVAPNTIHRQIQVWHTIANPGKGSVSQVNLDNLPPDTETNKPRNPWILVVRPGEKATPDLVRQLPEWVLTRDSDAFSVPIIAPPMNHTLFGRQSSFVSHRVFRQGSCKFELVQGEPTVVALEDRTMTKRVGIVANTVRQFTSAARLSRHFPDAA